MLAACCSLALALISACCFFCLLLGDMVDTLPSLELLKVSSWVVHSYRLLTFLFQDVSQWLMLATSCCWTLLVERESALHGMAVWLLHMGVSEAVMTGLLKELVANLSL